MAHLVQAKPISPKPAQLRWKKEHSSQLVQVTSCRNTSESQKRSLKLCSIWPENRNRQSFSSTKSIQWLGTDLMEKMKQAEG